MFEKILYPTDFSEVSKRALMYLLQLKEAGTKKVVVLHIVDKQPMEVLHRYRGDETAEIEQNVLKHAEKSLLPIAQQLESYGLEVEIKVVEGVPFQEILNAEIEEDVSAIVLGSHGVGNVKEMLLGSVSEKVIRKSKKPVLVIK